MLTRTLPKRRSGFSALAASVLLCSATLTACSQSQDNDAAPANNHYPVTIENCGTEVTIKSEPERVMLINAASVPALSSLGVLDKAIARAGAFPDEYYDERTRAELRKIPQLTDKLTPSGHLQISREEIVAQQPDLVLGHTDGISHETLGQVGIPMIKEPTFCPGDQGRPTFEDVYSQVRMYGNIFDREERAEEVVDELRARVEKATERAAKKPERTAAILYPTVGGGVTYAYGNRSMSQPQLEAAGLHNVFEDVDERVFEISPEELIARNPDVIIMLYSAGDPAKVEESVRNLPGADSLTALQNDDVLVQLFNFTEPATPLSVTGLEHIVDKFSK